MKRLIHSIIMLVAVTSCNQVHLAEKPETFYGDEKMTEILLELYLIDGAVSINSKEFKELGLSPKTYIYEKYNTDSITFSKNLAYYTDRVDKYIAINEEVEIRLTAMKEDLEASISDEAPESKTVNKPLILDTTITNKLQRSSRKVSAINDSLD